MSVRLSPSILKSNYQILSHFDLSRNSEYEAFNKAADIVYDWLLKKYNIVLRDMSQLKTTFEDKRDGNEVGVLYLPEEYKFIIRASHPDNEIPGRFWITDAEISKYEENMFFATRLSVTTLKTSIEAIPYSKPRFIDKIIDEVGLIDVFPIAKTADCIDTEEKLNRFIQLIDSPYRALPVVLITACFSEDFGEFEGFMLPVEEIATQLKGLAHTFSISIEMSLLLSEKIGRMWSAFDGAVRTYYPSLNRLESDYFKHPLLTKKSIRYRSDELIDGYTAFKKEFANHIKKFNLNSRTDWQKSNIGFYHAESLNSAIKLSESGKQTQKNLIQLYEKQIEQLMIEKDEHLALASSYADDKDILLEKIDEMKSRMAALKSQVEYFKSALCVKTNESNCVKLPSEISYGNIPSWLKQNYSDRIFLHARAERNIKDAVYEDIELIYKALKLLAEEYYQYRIGEIQYNEFLDKCYAVDPGLTENGAISDTAAGEQGEEYFVEYRGEKRKLERHLAKGNNKDKRFCLRIYFFWDEDEGCIVIGNLPYHLVTRAT